ncbi:hypothetical protein EV2_039432 [Malus domestica]
MKTAEVESTLKFLELYCGKFCFGLMDTSTEDSQVFKQETPVCSEIRKLVTFLLNSISFYTGIVPLKEVSQKTWYLLTYDCHPPWAQTNERNFDRTA